MTVEADIHPGLPAFTIVGLPDVAVQESRERVRAALVNSEFEFPLRRITVNLAPADFRKAGPGFDLALAGAVLAASGQVSNEPLDRLRPLRRARARRLDSAGARSAGLRRPGARRHGLARLVAAGGARPGGRAGRRGGGLRGRLAPRGGRPPPRPRGAGAAPPEAPGPPVAEPVGAELDLSDVRGHNLLIRAVEVAAAGGHNLFMLGPPGTGKSMLAQRIPIIMPAMTSEEAIGVKNLQWSVGLLGAAGFVLTPPFRSPHHTIIDVRLWSAAARPPAR